MPVSADPLRRLTMMHEIVHFHGSDRALLAECQALRYRIYHGDLGLDTPDLDHRAKLDIEERDPVCDFAAVRDGSGEIVGCVRMQPSDRRPFYAELEFDLLGDTWARTPHVEGARFAVTAKERGGAVPMLLFQAFRTYCLQRAADHVLSVAIVKGESTDRERLARLTRFVTARAKVATERGRPASGYEIAPPTRQELSVASDPDPDSLPPMLRLLANPRTTLCSLPAYCRRFGTFNFLLSTSLRGPHATNRTKVDA